MTERKRTKGQEEFEDTKGAIRIRISKNRQHNDRKKKGQKDKKSLKIPKGQSESVYRRTDNTMTERKRQKGKKKSLKIPKEKSESVYRRTDNTMVKRKSTKGQTTIYKTYT